MRSLQNHVKRIPRIEIDLGKIYRNTKRLKQILQEKKISMMGVTKGVLGSPKVAEAMTAAGIGYIADSRIENIRKMKAAGIKSQFVLIRTPCMSKIAQTVEYADLSLNSEIDIIRRLSEQALARNKIHNIILMVDLGDLREGILPGDMEASLKIINTFGGVKTIGIGTNLCCIGGILPDQAKMDELSDIASKLETKLNMQFEMVSGGNSANFKWIETSGQVGRINNLRIGEAVFTGCNALDYAPVGDLEKNTATLVAEIIELKDKDSIPSGSICTDAFGNTPSFADRGKIRRAILGIGRQDVLTGGISPVEDMDIIGSSSDHIVIDLKKNPAKVGDQVSFHITYGAMLSAMTSPYIEKVYLNADQYKKTDNSRFNAH